MKTWSTVVIAALLGAMLVVLAGCFGSTPPVVKVGLIAPFEELHRDDGYAVLHAVRLAVSQRNAAGGVAGRQVTLAALNDNGQPEQARRQAANLGVDHDVLGVVGPLQAATAQAAGQQLAGLDLPWLPLASLAPEEQPGGFALEASPAALAGRAAELLAEQGIAGPVAVVTDPAAAPAGLAGAIWLGDAAGGARLALALPPETALAGGPELGSPVFAGRAGAAAAGARWLSAGPSAANLPAAFIADYRALAGSDPSPQAALAYDAANLLLDAIDRAGRQNAPLTRQAVQQALVELGAAGWQGVTGPVNWMSAACALERPCWPRSEPSLVVHRW